MKFSVACTTAVLTLLLAGSLTSNAQRNQEDLALDILRLLGSKPSGPGLYERWEPRDPKLDLRITPDEADDELRLFTSKRSAVATALNTGRRRRRPTPALDEADPRISRPMEVGIINNVDTFLDILRDNLETMTSLNPAQRSTLFQKPPSVVNAPSSGGGGGGGTGIRRFHALRPILRSSGNIRSYNRRSFVKTSGYPGANRHDPGLLWTGLGR